jgi:uncharacterized protein
MQKRRSDEVVVILYGGEPLLNMKPCFKILDATQNLAQQERAQCHEYLITNGTLLTLNNIRELYDRGVENVQITLDGPREEHDNKRKYKNGRGTYDDIFKSLMMLTDVGIPVVLRLNIDKNTTAEGISSLLEDLKKINLKKHVIYFSALRCLTGACSDYAYMCLQDNELNILPTLWDLCVKKGFNISLRPNVLRIHCSSQSDFSYAVDPFGHICKCWEFLGDLRHRVGKIREDGKMIDIEGSYYSWLSRDPTFFESCRKCQWLPARGGGCASKVYAVHKAYGFPHCGDIKYMMKNRLKAYLKKTFPNISFDKRGESNG